jgi:hypothetical protein
VDSSHSQRGCQEDLAEQATRPLESQVELPGLEPGPAAYKATWPDLAAPVRQSKGVPALVPHILSSIGLTPFGCSPVALANEPWPRGIFCTDVGII